jgi:hypothetical protein
MTDQVLPPARIAALTKFARRALPVMDRLAGQGIFYTDFDEPCDIVCDFRDDIGVDPEASVEEVLAKLGDEA